MRIYIYIYVYIYILYVHDVPLQMHAYSSDQRGTEMVSGATLAQTVLCTLVLSAPSVPLPSRCALRLSTKKTSLQVHIVYHTNAEDTICAMHKRRYNRFLFVL